MKSLHHQTPEFPGNLLIKLPLLNFLSAAIPGAVLRYYLISPIPGFNYKNWLQVHSHLMFLGWITLALFIIILKKLPGINSRITIYSLVIFQLSVLGLFISFPMGGYGIASISFLTMNMIASFAVLVIVIKESKNDYNIGWKYIRSGLLFMVISSLGPLALGPLTVLGMKNTAWYDSVIYFYLHFQYNGWFFMAILGLIILDLPGEWIEKNITYLNKGWFILTGSVVLTYLLSIPEKGQSFLFNSIGGAGAIAQLTYLILLILKIKRSAFVPDGPLKGKGSWLFRLSLAALFIKMTLQVLSAVPAFGSFAFSHRNIIIAYLHLVLIGFASFYILAWYRKEGWIGKQGIPGSWSIMILIGGFLLNEFILLVSVTGAMVILIPYLLFSAAVIMVIGILGITFSFN